MEHVLTDCSGALRGVADWLRASWRYAAARREFERLDPLAVRDLGMSASEFDSYWAESEGCAETTRIRIARERGL